MSIFKKTNAPYLVSGALAIGTLLASGIFAVAPYVAFLAPVAALSLGLPFIVGGAIFSAVVIALSYAAVSKNNTISEKEAQLTEKEKDKNFQIASQEEIILKCMKEISEKDAVMQAQEQRISEQKTRLAEKNTELFDKQERLSKEGLNHLDLAVPSNERKQQANSLDYLNLATSKDLNHLNVEIPSPKSQPTKPEDKDIFYDAEPGEEKNTENHSPKSQPTKGENGQGRCTFGTTIGGVLGGLAVGTLGGFAGGFAGGAAGGVLGGFLGGFVGRKVECTSYAKSTTPTKLDEVKASSMDNGACLGSQM